MDLFSALEVGAAQPDTEESDQKAVFIMVMEVKFQKSQAPNKS